MHEAVSDKIVDKFSEEFLSNTRKVKYGSILVHVCDETITRENQNIP